MQSLGPLLGVFIALSCGTSCGGKQEPGELGDDCYRDADCKPGLVCVPLGEGRQCSNDVSGLASNVEGAPPMEAPEEAPEEVPPSTGGTAGL
jgi:hypothetical protein